MSRSKNTVREVTFSLRAPEAERAFLAGTFNDWSPEALPMGKDAEGTWSLSVDLEPGRYEYKFVVDGEWRSKAGDTSDVECECVSNCFGTENRVLDVS